MFLCNPQKSSASRLCITFLQITEKILTKDIFHWLELITEILSFLKLFSVRKTALGFFNISETLPECQQKNYISGIFWAFKRQLQILHAATYITLFLPDSNNCFLHIQCHIFVSVSTIFSFCVFTFSFPSGHETDSTTYNVCFDFIPTCQQYYKGRKCFIVHYQKKNVGFIIINPMLSYFHEAKYEFFLPPYQITLFLVFDQIIFSQLMLSHHILMNILRMNFYHYF